MPYHLVMVGSRKIYRTIDVHETGVLKIELLILLRLARFQNLGTPPSKSN